MSVSAILAHKGNEVFTAGSGDSLHAISKVLAEKRIGAAVVLDEKGKVCGIASERDIVRQVAEQGTKALSQPISDCMTHKVVSCSENDSIDSVMEKMTQGRFRHLPVMEGSKLTGIISIGDVVKLKIQQAEQDAEDLKKYIAG